MFPGFKIIIVEMTGLPDLSGEKNQVLNFG